MVVVFIVGVGAEVLSWAKITEEFGPVHVELAPEHQIKTVTMVALLTHNIALFALVDPQSLRHVNQICLPCHVALLKEAEGDEEVGEAF